MKSKTDTASFRALLRMAGRILGCILASAALLTDLSALPGSSGTAFTRYVADSVFYDTLLAAACFGLAYVLTGRAQAAKGSAHYLVSKQFNPASGRSTTGIKLLEGEDRVMEIARLLSGESITSEAIANARSLMQES